MNDKSVFVLVFSNCVSCCDPILDKGYNVIYAGSTRDFDDLIESKTSSKDDLVLGNVAKLDDNLGIRVSAACRDLAEAKFDPRVYKDNGPTRFDKKTFFSNSNTDLFVVYDNGKRYINETLFNVSVRFSHTQFVTRSAQGMFVRCSDGKASYNFDEVIC